MQLQQKFDAIIIGGSYAGLSAAMALGRSLRKVLIIDSGKPCNEQTPHSHNFLTRDGETPAHLAAIAKAQVLVYPSITYLNDTAINAQQTKTGFKIDTLTQSFESKKLILATGVKDIFPSIKGFAECWGISVLHCPYCHGYEVRSQSTGIIANDEMGYEFIKLISNWTEDLTLFTNGPVELDDLSKQKLALKNIAIIDKEIEELVHHNGLVNSITFKDGTQQKIEAIYARCAMQQNTAIAADLNCDYTPEGYITVTSFQQTTVPGIYAVGDCTTMMRSVASAVATGAIAGATLNRELVNEEFECL
ncbi:NAD(P)/FAD-dependent oxidoreductase [Pedobacter sp. Hv1]|uniref:NAD(P)/FAD-dependent oxidoreductase n=1 Tax=Pedobacter sp. Hv1 TaxID=1740090 RepID=UPI0006D8927B|nr:NAD(P)/FAD-dependent oxidoreductase [Pedobacter sp. Hv1]KQB99212.1 pyridine nucleotide-disulfide oxidoreductase [Pedobacter sp. Hv1]